MVTCSVISAVVVVVVAVADSAVSWHYRWPGGLWRPLLGLPEHAEPRWCYEVRVAAVGAGICPPLSTNFCSNEGSAASMFEGHPEVVDILFWAVLLEWCSEPRSYTIAVTAH